MIRRFPVRFSVATMADLAELIDQIRPEDSLETVMSGFPNVKAATVESAMISNACFSARCGSDLLCLFGLVRRSETEAVAWEIGTPNVRKHAKAFLEATPVGISMLMDAAPFIETFVNYIPSGWTGYIAWATKYLGAEFDNRDELRGDGHAFRRFVVRRKKGA